MKTNIQSIHFDASEQLQAFIEKKTAKLEKFFDEIVKTPNKNLRCEKSHPKLFSIIISYSSEIASTGQPAAQAPQLTQASASITY